ncbi:EF-hand domain-containing protein [Paucibacter sp. APW11]|uniref:EF-hand domain-containing protein n=1 Tax=Roseateles aquae TaxID=3077235 RepID=A0ABU3PDE0_9BURK|nr:EF-hand domain-containing protein [Paucibacter sp. APW11]MDT9000609.1 EF-hand domain-containing protein [Paucibacter sp. APW11]
MKRRLATTAAIALLACSAPSRAAPPAALQDPALPAQLASQAPLAEPSRGAALQAQVMAKLARQFQQADTQRRGALSLAEAQAAGFGYAAQHFEQMASVNAAGQREIRLSDLQAFVRRQQSR